MNICILAPPKSSHCRDMIARDSPKLNCKVCYFKSFITWQFFLNLLSSLFEYLHMDLINAIDSWDWI